jgi:hypothetical protein
MEGYMLGRIVGILLFPVLILGIIVLVQWVRTRDRQAALRTATAWWALLTAFACTILGVLGSALQRVP